MQQTTSILMNMGRLNNNFTIKGGPRDLGALRLRLNPLCSLGAHIASIAPQSVWGSITAKNGVVSTLFYLSGISTFI